MRPPGVTPPVAPGRNIGLIVGLVIAGVAVLLAGVGVAVAVWPQEADSAALVAAGRDNVYGTTSTPCDLVDQQELADLVGFEGAKYDEETYGPDDDFDYNGMLCQLSTQVSDVTEYPLFELRAESHADTASADSAFEERVAEIGIEESVGLEQTMLLLKPNGSSPACLIMRNGNLVLTMELDSNYLDIPEDAAGDFLTDSAKKVMAALKDT
ncbi:hypothetical protein Snas_3584 [Stackebrandtia nassauensis DSM 44728]|uniref:DUF3558 domain-containing protein n=2 Tax=Stackebrandtia TaxID=283810 RepID=D3PWM3_STANL|nr:hypothetical protein Snas_3584 [Stackebrandtia nassauensis DSM 44728]